MTMSTIKRIKEYIDYKGINNKQFEESVGFSNGSFSSQLKNNRTIGVDKLENILKVYPEINTDWLLTGKGPMLKEQSKKQEKENILISQSGNTSADFIEYLKEKVEILEKSIDKLRNRNLELERNNAILEAKLKIEQDAKQNNTTSQSIAG